MHTWKVRNTVCLADRDDPAVKSTAVAFQTRSEAKLRHNGASMLTERSETAQHRHLSVLQFDSFESAA